MREQVVQPDMNVSGTNYLAFSAEHPFRYLPYCVVLNLYTVLEYIWSEGRRVTASDPRTLYESGLKLNVPEEIDITQLGDSEHCKKRHHGILQQFTYNLCFSFSPLNARTSQWQTIKERR